MAAAEPSAISYETELPFAWRADPAPDEATLEGWLYANLALLRALARIETGTAITIEKEHGVDPYLVQVLERVESKLDMALNLLARLSAAQGELPHRLPVKLSAQHIEWTDVRAPDTAQEITLSLYLSPKLPEPLMLRARVTSVTPVFGGFSCVAELLERDDEFQEWMTRTVFRYHRRALQARHPQ